MIVALLEWQFLLQLLLKVQQWSCLDPIEQVSLLLVLKGLDILDAGRLANITIQESFRFVAILFCTVMRIAAPFRLEVIIECICKLTLLFYVSLLFLCKVFLLFKNVEGLGGGSDGGGCNWGVMLLIQLWHFAHEDHIVLGGALLV